MKTVEELSEICKKCADIMSKECSNNAELIIVANLLRCWAESEEIL